MVLISKCKNIEEMIGKCVDGIEYYIRIGKKEIVAVKNDGKWFLEIPIDKKKRNELIERIEKMGFKEDGVIRNYIKNSTFLRVYNNYVRIHGSIDGIKENLEEIVRNY